MRQKVDQLMNILYAGGVNNPMDSIEQCSYLLFLRLLTEKDETGRQWTLGMDLSGLILPASNQ